MNIGDSQNQVPGLKIKAPVLVWYNRQRQVRLSLCSIQEAVNTSLPSLLPLQGPSPSALHSLDRVEITIVSDRVMGRIHGQFLGSPDTTDVVTFDHGEIIISSQVALRNAKAYQTTVAWEIALYAVHGLLHLHGYTDTSPPCALEMLRVQKQLMATIQLDLGNEPSARRKPSKH